MQIQNARNIFANYFMPLPEMTRDISKDKDLVSFQLREVYFLLTTQLSHLHLDVVFLLYVRFPFLPCATPLSFLFSACIFFYFSLFLSFNCITSSFPVHLISSVFSSFPSVSLPLCCLSFHFFCDSE